ncbi:hypothetical protein BJ742DRAFT_738934 [Cladochytrium replicatum]|nr:hypothetical protein BJ742DRAFT_738934 [Cladochytrium replicatum]
MSISNLPNELVVGLLAESIERDHSANNGDSGLPAISLARLAFTNRHFHELLLPRLLSRLSFTHVKSHRLSSFLRAFRDEKERALKLSQKIEIHWYESQYVGFYDTEDGVGREVDATDPFMSDVAWLLVDLLPPLREIELRVTAFRLDTGAMLQRILDKMDCSGLESANLNITSRFWLTESGIDHSSGILEPVGLLPPLQRFVSAALPTLKRLECVFGVHAPKHTSFPLFAESLDVLSSSRHLEHLNVRLKHLGPALFTKQVEGGPPPESSTDRAREWGKTITVISQIISANKAHLHTVRMLFPNSMITGVGTALLADALKSSQIRVLEVSSVLLWDKGSIEIIRSLIDGSALATLEALTLEGCDIGDGGAAVIAELVTKAPRLRKLVLADNGIQNEGADAIASALVSSSSLQVLSLSKNPGGDDGLLSLGRAINKSNLHTFLLTDFANCTQDGLTLFAKALAGNQNLRILMLDGWRFGAFGEECLAESIQSMQLTDLHFSDGLRQMMTTAIAGAVSRYNLGAKREMKIHEGGTTLEIDL